MKLYPHQEKFLNDDPNYAILCWEAGLGKTMCSNLWLRQKDRIKNAVVVCPKQIRGEWQEKTPEASVYSFEDFKKARKQNTLPHNITAIVIDEVDNLASPLFVANKRSQRTEDMYHYLMENPQAHVLCLSATPVRSSPWNLHTILVFAKLLSPRKELVNKYRERFFSLQNKPYLPRPAWLPKDGWRQDIQNLINKYTYTALMQDVVELPPETHEVITRKPPDYAKNEEWEPAAQFANDHKLEQVGKDKTIREIARRYRKIVVVCKYRDQIDSLYETLSKDRPTYILDGRTKDAQRVVADANNDPECFLLLQNSIAAGFELPTFAVMIFASQTYGVRDFVQCKARIKRINALKPVKYFYLQGGRCDKMVYNSVMAGRDFVPSFYLSEKSHQ